MDVNKFIHMVQIFSDNLAFRSNAMISMNNLQEVVYMVPAYDE